MIEHPPLVAAPVGGRWTLVLHLALLLVVSAVVRLPSHGVASFTVDEGQYLSTIAYLQANDQSVFAALFGPPWAMSVYSVAADFEGPYPIATLRWTITLVSAATAFMLYDLVRRGSSNAAGLGAGLFFIYYNPLCEGYSANTEWLSSPVALAVAWLYVQAPRLHERPLRFLALGGLAGVAFVLKGQASFLLGVVPIAVLLESIAERKVFIGLRGVVAFTAGAAIVVVASFFPFFVVGLGWRTVEHFFKFIANYVFRNDAPPVTGAVQAVATLVPPSTGFLGTPAALKTHFVDTPDVLRAVRTIAYVAAGCWIAAGLRRAFAGGGAFTTRERILLTAGLSLAASVGCVSLGGRYLGHYYLYFAPPLAVCVALTIDRVVRPIPCEGMNFYLAATAAALLTMDLASLPPLMENPLAAVGVVLALVFAALWLHRATVFGRPRHFLQAYVAAAAVG
ncbi:MAG: hypothetical protein ACRDD1_07315, partial [Planctomycetia bacterium]